MGEAFIQIGKERVFTCIAANSIARGRRSRRSQMAATSCDVYTPLGRIARARS